MTEDALRIAPIRVPDDLDAADAEPFRAIARLGNAVCRQDGGHDYLDQDPAEVWGFWRDDSDWIHVGFAASRGGPTLGVATLQLSREAGTSVADIDVIVDPVHRGEGIEEALLERVEAEARTRGIAVVQTWTLHRPNSGGSRLTPSTGWGSIPADDPQTVFATRAGFTLEQVERQSSYDLRSPLAPVQRMLAEASAFAGEDYRALQWVGPAPDTYVDAFAYAVSRMSTDAPAGGLDVEEQHWDAARMRRRDARLAAQGLTASVAVAVHVPSGTVAAFNELVIGGDGTGATQQYGTLVLAEHRGRRLGTVVKCLNLVRWREVAPRSPRVSTFNAEENRHMLAINEAIGFVPVSYAGGWKKRLGGGLSGAAAAAGSTGSSGSSDS